MSWSVAAVGRAEAVAEAIERQFTNGTSCSEPEESVRQAARTAIAEALKGQGPTTVVKVQASGSQSGTYQNGTWGAPYTNQLQIEVTPLYGFVE